MQLDRAQTDRAKLWFRTYKAESALRARLFVFPFAGGGAAAFRSWPEHLPSAIETNIVQLAGRESRFGERPATRGVEIVEAVSQAITTMSDVPFVIQYCAFKKS